MKWILISGIALSLSGCSPNGGSTANEPADQEPPTHLALDKLGRENAWSESYRQSVEFRAGLTEFQKAFHRFEGQTISSPFTRRAQRGSHPAGVRLVRSPPDERSKVFRLQTDQKFLPPQGFRMFGPDEDGISPASPAGDELSAQETVAADLIRQRLASDGLLVSLVEIIRVLQPSGQPTDHRSLLTRLRRVRFPTDLIRFFPIGGEEAHSDGNTLAHIAEQLALNRKAELLEELQAVPFVFRQSRRGFMSATESGDEKIGLIQTQIGGGYFYGVTPGGSIDVAGQLVKELPEVDFLISTPRPMFENLHRLLRTWPIRRPGQVTLVEAPSMISGWAQDNGKAGVIRDRHPHRLATIVPRYASVDEAPLACLPGDSILFQGLETAGHEVIRSPLLFQGGNLLTVVDSDTRQRWLLISESDVAKNVALGLTTEQVSEAFREEFGVDRCVVMRSVSHHLDFDLSVRNHQGQTIAFVNDIKEARRLILEQGVTALVAARLIPHEEALRAREEFRDGDEREMHELLKKVVYDRRDAAGVYPLGLVKHFSANEWEAAGPNFQSFLTAADLLTCRVLTPAEILEHSDRDYLLQLQNMLAAADALNEQLTRLGWKITPIPSLPDIGVPTNYLNGIQDLQSYIIPVSGAFYRSLDNSAMQTFREALGNKISLIPIRSAECQRNHGAVHCTAVAYPRLEPGS